MVRKKNIFCPACRAENIETNDHDYKDACLCHRHTVESLDESIETEHKLLNAIARAEKAEAERDELRGTLADEFSAEVKERIKASEELEKRHELFVLYTKAIDSYRQSDARAVKMERERDEARAEADRLRGVIETWKARTREAMEYSEMIDELNQLDSNPPEVIRGIVLSSEDDHYVSHEIGPAVVITVSTRVWLDEDTEILLVELPKEKP